MSNEVQFDIDQVQRTSFNPKRSIFVRLVTNYSGGLIKDERQANFVLLVFSIITLTLSLFLFFRDSGLPQKPSQEEILRVMIPPSVPMK